MECTNGGGLREGPNVSYFLSTHLSLHSLLAGYETHYECENYQLQIMLVTIFLVIFEVRINILSF